MKKENLKKEEKIEERLRNGKRVKMTLKWMQGFFALTSSENILEREFIFSLRMELKITNLKTERCL